MSPLAVRADPDPTLPPTAELAPGDEVAVLERRGAWAEVMTLSGARGWVDGGQLVEPAATTRPSPAVPASAVAPAAPRDNGERNGWIFIGVIALLVAVAAVVIASSGSSSSKTATRSSSQSAPPTTSPTPETNLVKFQVPAGWSVSSDGLVIAEQQSDLTAATPKGARVTAAVGPNNDDPVAILQRAQSAGSSFDVIEPPIDTATVSGAQAVRMTIRDGSQIVQFIGVHPPGHDGVLFTVECPADRFEQLQDAINSAPGLNL